MRRLRVGDIVVVTSKCWSGCNICTPHLGYTALVVKAYKRCDEVGLQFTEQVQGDAARGGFFKANLFNTGLSA